SPSRPPHAGSYWMLLYTRHLVTVAVATQVGSARLSRLGLEIAREIGEGFVGEEVAVLLTEPGKGTTVLARTPEYRQVVLPGPVPLGRFARVRIVEAHPTDLRGRVLGVVSAAPSPASPS